MSTTAAEARPVLSDSIGAVGLIGVVALMMLPLPAALLDLLLALSLCLAVLVFLVAVYIERPLDFSAFPSLLLLVTLFRLSLNVASTRRILLHGAEGFDSAGGIIQAFGEFAVGGNFVVGAVVFLILVLVNFIVITKGAERISEVAARFTLDKMPGKQMAIDADLGAGLINEKEARARRQAIEQEADFHGAMDGASKFVRGDAVAGLIIVGINIVGGIIVGVAQQHVSIETALKTYTILSIGEGLVTQLPALLVSTGAALLTTRGSSTDGLGNALGRQLLSGSRATGAASLVLVGLGLVPGMPHIAFFALAGTIMVLGRRERAAQSGESSASTATGAKLPADPATTQKHEIEAVLPIELLALEVGIDLLPMVDVARGGELLGRIASLRKQLALELGLVVPPVHVRDDIRLRPDGYRVLISGVRVAEGQVRAGRLLAIDPTGQSLTGIAGDVVREPTFGLPAKWIVAGERMRAEASGCTVVDPSSVITTQLTETLRRYAHELLGRREAQELLELASQKDAKVVEELVPHLLPLGELIKVLRNLLQEGISIRDMRSILETLADNAAQTKDPGQLTELVRQRLSRQITARRLSENGELAVSVLDPQAEELFRPGAAASDPRALSRVTAALEEATRNALARDEEPVVIVAPDIRRAVAQVALRHIPGLSVLSYREIDASVPLVTRSVIAAKESRA